MPYIIIVHIPLIVIETFSDSFFQFIVIVYLEDDGAILYYNCC